MDAALGSAAAAGKVLSVSSHTSLASDPEYFNAYAALLASHGNGIRFTEFWTGSVDDFMTLSHVANDLNLPAQIHTATRTLAPDWLELAVFLLAAGEHSYFSFSGPWMLDSFAVMPEYTRPLGAPLGPATLINGSAPVQAWAPIPNLNIIYDWPPAPNASIPGKLSWLGLASSGAACMARAAATSGATAGTCTSMEDMALRVRAPL